MKLLATTTLCLLVAVATVGCGKAKFVGWRGDGTGIYPDTDPVTSWDSDEKDKGILWKVAVGSSYSQPVIVGDRAIVTSEASRIVVVDLKTQKVLWDKNNFLEDLDNALDLKDARPYPTSCGFSSPTPICDGNNIWASFGTGIVVCYDMDGNRKWVVYHNVPQQTEYGRSAAPVMVDGKLIVTIGYLIALDPATGKTLWKVEDAAEAYGSPVVAKVGGVTMVVTAQGDVVRVSDGELLARGLSALAYSSPIVEGDVAYFAAARSRAFKLTMADGKLDAKKIWQTDLEGSVYASPVVKDGILYAVLNEGALFAVDAVKGDILYQQNLDMASAAAMPGMPPGNLYP